MHKNSWLLGECILGIVVLEALNICVLGHNGGILMGVVGTLAGIVGYTGKQRVDEYRKHKKEVE